MSFKADVWLYLEPTGKWFSVYFRDGDGVLRGRRFEEKFVAAQLAAHYLQGWQGFPPIIGEELITVESLEKQRDQNKGKL